MDSSKKRISDRIYRINWIVGPSAKGYLTAGEKIFTPLNFEEQRSVFNQGYQSCKSCQKKETKDRIHSILSVLEGKQLRLL